MSKPGASSTPDALFLSPETPQAGAGGGGLRSLSLLEYLRSRYRVEVASFKVPYHSKSTIARAWRNGWRFLRGVPPLLDRFSGFANQLHPHLDGRHYRVAVVEHFWCAPYAAQLRPHADILVLDLHNIESELARSHALAAGGLESIVHTRFANAYRRLESRWIPEYDIVLVASEEDGSRVDHPEVHVYPNALPEIGRPDVAESHAIAFSGNLEYHPNVSAVEWFAKDIWPNITGDVEWRLIGKNPEPVAHLLPDDPRVKLIGPVDDAVRALAEAKICVVPLLSGSGTRFKILEAWAAGRAVVSTALGAEGLGAKPGEHLLIADQPAAFAEAVQRLLDDPLLRKRLGEAGRKLYLDRFTWNSAWQNLSELF